MYSSNPELLLKLAGFERAPDRGWQIPFKYTKPTRGNIWLPPGQWIPTERLHALVVGEELNLHLDAKRSKRRHRSFQHSNRVDVVAYLLKALNKEIFN